MRPLPLTVGHILREQMASARRGSNQALTSGRLSDPALSLLSYWGGQISSQIKSVQTHLAYLLICGVVPNAL